MQGLVVNAHGELFHLFLWGCVHSCVNVGGRGHKRKIWVLDPPSTLKWGFLFTTTQTRLAGPRASGDSPASVSHFSQECGECGDMHHRAQFCVGSGDLTGSSCGLNKHLT